MVTGSGTSGYVSKWTGTYTQGNSVIYDNGTNVGIGTTAPGEKLHVVGDIKIVSDSDLSNSLGTGALYVLNTGNTIGLHIDYNEIETVGNILYLQHDGAQDLSVGNGDLFVETSGGNVGIGTTAPSEKLEVSGNVKATAFYYGSDQSLKTNIKPFDKSLQKVLNLEPVYFDYKENNQHSLGFIAQDVEKQFPELVTTDSLTGLKSLDYSRLTAPLVMAIKEQQIQIESQQQQINELKTQLNNL